MSLRLGKHSEIMKVLINSTRCLSHAEETQANLPPSEQQVQEPKKYMGSAIPSRSFRILQAMTAPESIGEYPYGKVKDNFYRISAIGHF